MPAMRTMLRGFSLVLLAFALTACRQSTPVADLPAPAYGTDRCAACGAVIEVQSFAAQYRLPDGAVRSFDDPACLFDALRKESTAPALIRFHDHDRDAWLTPEQAWFARTASTVGHGSGWAAYASFAAAQDAVATAGGGEILPYEQAKNRLSRSGTPP
jgi:hypothetical protein